jgi:hypothetical protein
VETWWRAIAALEKKDAPQSDEPADAAVALGEPID